MSFSKWAGMKSRRAFLGAALGATAVVSLQAEPAVAQDKLIPFAISTARSAAGVPEYYAKKYGIFEKNGLDVKMTEFAGAGNSIAAIQGGSLQAAYVIPGSAFTAIQNGLDLVFVAQQEVSKRTAPDTGSLQVLATSNIQTLADLKGKKIAIAVIGSPSALAVQQLMRKAGVKPGEYDLLEMPFVAMFNALKAKQVDAVTLINPFTTQGLTTGVGRVVAWPYVDSVPGQPINAWVAKKAFVAQNPDLFDRFTRSLREAIDALNADPAKARQEVAAVTGLDPELLKNMLAPSWDYNVRLADWDGTITLMKDEGVLKNPPKAETYMTPAMLKFTDKK